jgi:hypothetical protein
LSVRGVFHIIVYHFVLFHLAINDVEYTTDRQSNGQMKKNKMTNNDVEYTTDRQSNGQMKKNKMKNNDMEYTTEPFDCLSDFYLRHVVSLNLS